MATKVLTEQQRVFLHDALAILFGMASKERIRFNKVAWPTLEAAWDIVRQENEPPLGAPGQGHKQTSNIILPPGAQANLQ